VRATGRFIDKKHVNLYDLALNTMSINKPTKRSYSAEQIEAAEASSELPGWLKWLVGAAAATLAIWFLVNRSQKLDELASFERDGGPILEAAASWREQHGKLGCPTLSQLIQDRFLPKSAQEGGKRFRILCSPDEVHLEKLDDNGHPIAEDPLRINQHVAPHEG
jgi:hypothetical protein